MSLDEIPKNWMGVGLISTSIMMFFFDATNSIAPLVLGFGLATIGFKESNK